ncbi:lysozyme [Actinobacillus equuli subsp. haemolyticus]|uniref:lysozyme n=1 Tax=Actinobacillus equuli TaxID=718 RepID=UPI0024415344|nr:lysozyme [Actinobacillus equuli]WGE78039.1 lysozyme [Actinobacillus equuli subsp. haemolyticus]
MSKSVKLGVIVCAVTAIVGIVQKQHTYINTGEQGLELIGKAEGCRRDPYKCPADVLTVGIGSTEAAGQKIDVAHKYTNEEIAERWAKDLAIAEKCVNDYGNGRKMPQGAFDAMTSLTFNVGCGAIKNSTLFKMAQNGYSKAMCDQFPRWVYSGGVKLNGLVARRMKERQLCLT